MTASLPSCSVSEITVNDFSPLNIHVDSVKCATLTCGTGVGQTITCSQGVIVGKVVRLTKERENLQSGNRQLSFCEFQIYGKYSQLHVLCGDDPGRYVEVRVIWSWSGIAWKPRANFFMVMLKLGHVSSSPT
jgi:hypothetical protein